MMPPRDLELKTFLPGLRELPEAEREKQLAEITLRDPELAGKLRELLTAGGENTGIPEPAVAAMPLPADLAASRGYTVLAEISRGGQAVVYLAERADGEFRRRVAIKVLHRFAADAESVFRLRMERQILAGLQHPNIARLLDGGTTPDGYPYLVMEYIEGGLPINEWCRTRLAGLRQRLGLFLTCCDAVDFAHRHLVVHRDLKPGNLMVTGDGELRLLDFGIAKLMGEGSSSHLTVTGFQPLTPQYASPEQMLGQPITTASDIYSLGVILYELLTGSSPYGDASRSAARLVYTILNHDPAPPSSAATGPAAGEEFPAAQRNSLARSIRGDLDAIVLKALQKNPANRYASAGELAQDIRRYLAGQPVQARRQGWWYRAGKLVRKHRALAGVSLAALTVIALAGAYAWNIRRNSEEKTRLAQDLGREVERIDAMMQVAHLLPRHDIRPAREQVQNAMRRIRERAGQMGPAAAPLASYALGRGEMSLDNFEAARAHLEKAWNSGIRESGISSALGLTLTTLYRDQSAMAARIPDPEQREARRQ